MALPSSLSAVSTKNWHFRRCSTAFLWSVLTISPAILAISNGTADNISCQNMQSLFNFSGLGGNNVLKANLSDDNPPVCNNKPATCCSQAVQLRLLSQSMYLFNRSFSSKLSVLDHTLANVTSRFDVGFLKLLNDTKVDLHRMFVKNYGLLYQQNSQIFFDMFRAFREFYTNGSVDLPSALADFFASLFQRIFVLLNTQHSFNDEYQECIAENTERIRPFGSIPKQMSLRIEKSFVATRVFSRSLATGRDVFHELVNKVEFLSFPTDCWRNITQLFYCQYCQGETSRRACFNSCTNVVTYCLQNQWDLGLFMTSYVDELLKLAEKLEGPYNIESVVQPIETKLYEAMEYFQSNLNAVSAKVVQLCGPLSFDTRRKRHLSTDGLVGSGPVTEYQPSVAVAFNGNRSYVMNSSAPDRTVVAKNASVPSKTLTELVSEIRNLLSVVRHTWCHVPRNVCAELTDVSSGECWNGTSTERSSIRTTDDRCFYTSLAHRQVSNSSSVSYKLILQLQSMALKMRSAHGTPISDWNNDDDDGAEESGDGLDEYSGSGEDDSVNRGPVSSLHTSPYELDRSTESTRTASDGCRSCLVVSISRVFFVISCIGFLSN